MTESHPANTAPTNPHETVSSLCELLERQRKIYQQLRRLSDQQRDHISNGSAQTLLQVLSHRQRLMDELTRVSDRLAPYRQNWSELWPHWTDDQRHQIGGLLDQIKDLLTTIIHRDDQDRQDLEQAKQQVSREMGRLTQTGTALQAYKAAPPLGHNRFTDRQG